MARSFDKQNINSQENFLWVLKNQPPVMHWWFALSGISIVAVYFVMFANL